LGYLDEAECIELAPKVTFEVFNAGMEIIKTGDDDYDDYDDDYDYMMMIK
jgi:hypothetical protein